MVKKLHNEWKVKIKGIQPIIWNVMKRELELEKKELKKDQLNGWEEDPKNWKRKAELKNNKVIIPERWFKSVLIESCKKNRIIPHFATRKSATYTNYVTSFMVFNGETLCEMKDLQPFSSYVGAQGKNSTTKVWRVRPMKEKWTANFTIVDPSSRMTREELKEIIDYAGLMIGLGDNRINNFGRFETVSLKEA
tara:strand:- start:12 stop:590 length:579 start_codon:yes stop_codon:yes gene_type:complete